MRVVRLTPGRIAAISISDAALTFLAASFSCSAALAFIQGRELSALRAVEREPGTFHNKTMGCSELKPWHCIVSSNGFLLAAILRFLRCEATTAFNQISQAVREINYFSLSLDVEIDCEITRRSAINRLF